MKKKKSYKTQNLKRRRKFGITHRHKTHRNRFNEGENRRTHDYAYSCVFAFFPSSLQTKPSARSLTTAKASIESLSPSQEAIVQGELPAAPPPNSARARPETKPPASTPFLPPIHAPTFQQPPNSRGGNHFRPNAPANQLIKTLGTNLGLGEPWAPAPATLRPPNFPFDPARGLVEGGLLSELWPLANTQIQTHTH